MIDLKFHFKSFALCKFWLVIPLLPDQGNEVSIFLTKHKWFVEKAGNILFKSSGGLDVEIANAIEDVGCKLIQTKDAGIYDAWNQAMDYLEECADLDGNEYVAFLGLDDILIEDFCIAVVGFLKYPNIPDFIFGNSRLVLDGRFKDRISPINPKLFGKNGYVFDVPHPGLMNRWGSIKYFRFDLRYRLAADFDFYIGIARATNIAYVKLSIIQAIIGSNGMSNSVKALDIYLQEWMMIASNRAVNLAVPKYKFTLMKLISTFPFVFRWLRRSLWIVRGEK